MKVWPFGVCLQELASNRPKVALAEVMWSSKTVHLASNKPVIAALQDSNLKEVVQELKQLFPQREIIIFGDDDRHLPNRKPPLPNSGRMKAIETAEAVGGKAVFPQFTSEEQGSEFTDFADLNNARGLEAVKRQVLTVAKDKPRTAIEKLKDARAKQARSMTY